MRVLVAFLIVLVSFAGSAAGFAVWGAHKVAPQVSIDTSCLLLELAERKEMLSRSQRFNVIQKAIASRKLSASAIEMADRLRNGCPKSAAGAGLQ
jgi:hypothetical protein